MQYTWLVNRSNYQKNRDHLTRQMKKYYYGSSEKVYNAWSYPDIKSWLVDHNVVKPEAH